MSFPGSEHLFFIPGVLLLGIILGYVMGSRATRAEIERKRQRAKE